MKPAPRVACALALLAAASCSRPAAAPAGAPGWEAMTARQRHEYMKSVVTPRMAAVFVAFDRHRYPKVDCLTCHGETGPKRGWVMPNPDLLLEPSPWNSATSPDPASASSPMERFMATAVVGELSALVGRPAGCFACHSAER